MNRVKLNPIPYSELFREVDFLYKGGWWKPVTCISRHKVAVVIPLRNHKSHLLILLRQLHDILRRQELMYRIIVVEQADEYPFNRGKLMNVGYAEALKITSFTCFVFHDVDLIPENDVNDYGCPTSPRHLSCAVDKFGYQSPNYGGVEMFIRKDFIRVNGFPNAYWGWEAEDGNLNKRISKHELSLTRPTIEVGRYKMIEHTEPLEKVPTRHEKLENSNEQSYTDGLSSLQYKVLEKTYEDLYTRVKVDLQMEGDMIY